MSSAGFDKKCWHQRNYEFLKRFCYDKHNRYIGSYLEIVDDHFSEEVPLYKDVPGRRLIAVNNDPGIIYSLSKKNLGRTLVCGDAFEVARALSRQDTSLERVTAFNFDTQMVARNTSFWEGVSRKNLGDVIRDRAYNKKPNGMPLGCGLILNFVLASRDSDKPSDNAVYYANALEALLKAVMGHRARIPSLVGPDNGALEDWRWVGYWGPHEVYRSFNKATGDLRHHRMITTRLWVHENTITLEKSKWNV